MEYERKFWIKSHVPTGLGGWPKNKPKKIIPEESYKQIKQMFDDGKNIKEIASMMGCSTTTLRKLKETL